ncbi:MAG: GFA family protein [Solirubrobacteraceae bacterium]|nr:GFA family protein [Solirubrobacteraceae bacterium]
MADDSAPTTPALTGGCGCGAVRYEVSEPLIAAAYCHCTICQRRTGTAVQASAMAAYGSITVTAGDEHLRSWQPTPQSNAKQFCGTCGSALFAVNADDPEIVFVRLGSVDGDPGIRPGARQFVAYAAPWEPIPDDGLPRFDERVQFPSS